MSEQRRPTGQVGPQRPQPAAEDQKLPPSSPASGTDTVTVACKMPNGIILHVDDMIERTEASPAGYDRVKRAQPRPEKFVIAGPAVDMVRLQADGGLEKLIVGGYGLTSGIPREFWEKWLEQNAHTEMVRNHQIFAMPTESAARSKAREQAKIRSGLEPINRDNPSERMPASRGLRIEPGTATPA